MFGRNGGKGRSARSSKSDTVVRPEEPTPVPPTIREHDAHSGSRPVHLVEDKRLGAQK